MPHLLSRAECVGRGSTWRSRRSWPSRKTSTAPPATSDSTCRLTAKICAAVAQAVVTQRPQSLETAILLDARHQNLFIRTVPTCGLEQKPTALVIACWYICDADRQTLVQHQRREVHLAAEKAAGP